MRIRKKLIVLHTLFSLFLAALLLVLVRPAIRRVVEQAEADEAKTILALLAPDLRNGSSPLPPIPKNAELSLGTATELGLGGPETDAARSRPGEAVHLEPGPVGAGALLMTGTTPSGEPRFALVRVRIPAARDAVIRMYFITSIALLGVYALVAVALELLVLPQNVYAPIRRMLEADRAVQEGRSESETIPESLIPSDEMGEIMRSRNESIASLRKNQAALAQALDRLEEVATDLARKNHLLETARRNLADADRLASLGMMSAGIAHELNTPLAVLKGLVEKLNADASSIEPAQAALMLRVVQRLERLGDSLLDFARARSPRAAPTLMHSVVSEAATLVRLDRQTVGVEFDNSVPESLVVSCDPDRMVQVFVNLLRNSADALRAASPRRANSESIVRIESSTLEKDGRQWASLTVSDDGPGIDPAILSRLFEPFASTRLDARGTGLGLAVADAIVREHGGVILARNRQGGGAVFEVLLPLSIDPIAQPVSHIR